MSVQPSRVEAQSGLLLFSVSEHGLQSWSRFADKTSTWLNSCYEEHFRANSSRIHIRMLVASHLLRALEGNFSEALRTLEEIGA
eukprot:s1066_g14.t1